MAFSVNNLQTTTTSTPTFRHPLVGLMGISAYTVAPNRTVETFGGHSKVTTKTFKKCSPLNCVFLNPSSECSILS